MRRCDKIYLPRPTEPDLTNRMENDMKEVDPQSTARALAFELWMKVPMPMVTLMKTLDVTPLVRMSRKRGYKFHMLLCWCIGGEGFELGENYMVIGTSALAGYEIDGAVNIYAGYYNNPFHIWGKYR